MKIWLRASIENFRRRLDRFMIPRQHLDAGGLGVLSVPAQSKPAQSKSLRAIALACVGVVVPFFASAFVAQAQTIEFGRAGNFTILKEPYDRQSCRAYSENRQYQDGWGRSFLIALEKGNWQIWTDYQVADGQTIPVLVDGKAFNVRFEQMEEIWIAGVDRNMIDAIRAGNRINLNLDPEGPEYSLRGSARAIDLLEACVRSGG